MSDTNPDQTYTPTDRADVDKTETKPRARKYADGKKLRKKNAQGVFEFTVTVVSASYNSTYHRWEYTLKDWEDKSIDGTTKEADLR